MGLQLSLGRENAEVVGELSSLCVWMRSCTHDSVTRYGHPQTELKCRTVPVADCTVLLRPGVRHHPQLATSAMWQRRITLMHGYANCFLTISVDIFS